jgi:hypothetical protein
VLRHDKRRNSADALRYLRRTTANRAIGGYRLVNDREISRRGLQPALIASARDVGARMRFTPESTQLSWFRRSRRNSVSARRRSQVSRIAFSQRRCDSRLSGWGGSVTRSKCSPSSPGSFAWFAGSRAKPDSPAEAYFRAWDFGKQAPACQSCLRWRRRRVRLSN